MTVRTTWDYTELAEAYLLRPDYATDVVARIAAAAREAWTSSAPLRCCDVGAGAAHLTRLLAAEGFCVDAVEPNAAMRANGVRRTAEFPAVTWSEGVGEATGRPARTFALVTFGSSFNVCDRELALAEAARLLVDGGVFACLWNHRDLTDPLQAEIEATIRGHLPDYDYGSRRADQSELLNRSADFRDVTTVEGSVLHRQTAADCVQAWRSHATLQRQAVSRFDAVVADIERVVRGAGETVEVPYVTRGWMAIREG